MKIAGNVLGGLGVMWIAYFWLAVFWYPRIRLAMPSRLNGVVSMIMISAGLCALAGKIVSKRWWAGVALALVTLVAIYARVH